MKKLMTGNFVYSGAYPHPRVCSWDKESIVGGCLTWPAGCPEPEGPYDWRDGARKTAELKGQELNDSDLVSVRSYFEFQKGTGLLGSLEIVDDVQVEGFELPAGGVVLGSPGMPIVAFWEE